MSVTRTEDLTDQVNGMAASFLTTVQYVTGTLVVHLNGQRLRPGISNDYVEDPPNGFTLTLTPDLGEALMVQYETDATVTGFPLVTAYTSDPGF